MSSETSPLDQPRSSPVLNPNLRTVRRSVLRPALVTSLEAPHCAEFRARSCRRMSPQSSALCGGLSPVSPLFRPLRLRTVRSLFPASTVSAWADQLDCRERNG
jgi:hypothetical protein